MGLRPKLKQESKAQYTRELRLRLKNMSIRTENNLNINALSSSFWIKVPLVLFLFIAQSQNKLSNNLHQSGRDFGRPDGHTQNSTDSSVLGWVQH